MRQVTAAAVERLVRAVREAPGSINALAPVMRPESPEVSEMIVRISAGQQALHAQLAERKLTGAARLQVLLGDPADPSALNGLGTILMFRRDLDAAEFFIQAAIAQAERLKMDYPDARHDLSLVRRMWQTWASSNPGTTLQR